MLQFVIKIIVLSIFEWPFYTGFIECLIYQSPLSSLKENNTNTLILYLLNFNAEPTDTKYTFARVHNWPGHILLAFYSWAFLMHRFLSTPDNMETNWLL